MHLGTLLGVAEEQREHGGARADLEHGRARDHTSRNCCNWK